MIIDYISIYIYIYIIEYILFPSLDLFLKDKLLEEITSKTVNCILVYHAYTDKNICATRLDYINTIIIS